MVGTRTRTARGLVVLALAGAVAGAALAGPVTAAAPLATKKFVKRQIKKLSSNVIHQPVYYRRSDPVAVGAGDFNSGFVACPTGTSALGGGTAMALTYAANVEASLPSSGLAPTAGREPLAGTTGWAATVESDGSAFNFRVYVICAAVQKDSNYADGSAAARMTGASREA